MRIGRNSMVKLANVVSETVNKKTGTVVQKEMVKMKHGLFQFNGMETEGVTKLITYGKNTPLRKIGIDQVKVTTLKNGENRYEYFNKGKTIFGMGWGNGFGEIQYPVLPRTYSCSEKQNLSNSVKKLIDSLKIAKRIN